MNTFLCALSTLTVFPVGKNFSPSEKEIRNSANFYPLTGLLLGILLGGIAIVLCNFLPTLLCAVILTFLSEVPTRAFHLDGLSDTFDGFLSSRSREKMLEIMHDSRCGVMGILAILLWGLLKFSAFQTLLENDCAIFTGCSVFFMTLYGRCALVYHLSMCPYARKDGLGKLVFDCKPPAGIVTAVIFSGLIWVLPGDLFRNLLPLLLPIFCYCWSSFSIRRIGGGTGDTLGACEEITEVGILLCFALL